MKILNSRQEANLNPKINDAVDNLTKKQVKERIEGILKEKTEYSYAVKNLINLVFETPRKYRLRKAGLVRKAISELLKENRVEMIEGYFRRYKWKNKDSMVSI